MKHQFIKILFVVIGSLALASCGAPLQTVKSLNGSGVCANGDGGYHLPRKLFTAKVSEIASDPVRYNLEITERENRVSDGRQTYCLDFKGSILSEDHISYKIDEFGLIESIYTKTIDKSKLIVDDLGKAVKDAKVAKTVDAFSNLRETEDNESLVRILADVEFDPFVQADVAFANDALEPYGYCFYLDPSQDNYVPSWMATMCPAAGTRSRAKRTKSSKLGGNVTPAVDNPNSGLTSVSDKASIGGVLYRPNITHDLVVMRQLDPGGRDPWSIYSYAPMEMPNAAPVLVAKISRSTFIKREVEMRFDKGVLVDVAMTKQSELNAALDIPISIANTIFSIPGEILKVRADDAIGRQKLISANQKLLDQIESYQETLEKADQSLGAARSKGKDGNERGRDETNWDRFSDEDKKEILAEAENKCKASHGGLPDGQLPKCGEKFAICQVNNDAETEERCMALAVEGLEQ